jgi:hypothetical protein
MRAVCVREFMDLKENVLRKEGETFTVSAERFAQINSTKYGTLAEKAKPKQAAGEQTEEE